MTDRFSASGLPYEIVSVQRAQRPPDGKGFTWHRYVIAFEGTITIYGCRQGGLKAVTRSVEEMVAQMNKRYLTRATKPSRVDLVLKNKTHK